MKIGVISDSHGDLKNLEKALKAMGEVDAIFHLGDYVSDGSAVQKIKKSLPVYTLWGNCDYGREGGVEYVNTLIGGKRIIACHGHAFGVKSSLNRYFYQAQSEEADIALYGHTHCAFMTTEAGILIMNPGAVCHTWGEQKSFGLIEIERDRVSGKILPF